MVLFGMMMTTLVGFVVILHSRSWSQQVVIPVYEGDDYREGLIDLPEDVARTSQKETDGENRDRRKGGVDHSSHNHASDWKVRHNSTIGFLQRYVDGVQGGSECEDDYGMSFIRRWQSYGKDYCLPPSSSSSTSLWKSAEGEDFRLETKIRCHSLVPSHQTPEPHSVCLAENVVVDFGRLGVQLCEGNGCHNDVYDGEKTIFFKPGVVRGNCRQVVAADEGWNTNNLVKTVGNWLVRSWQNLEDSPLEAKSLEAEVCKKENTVDHFVYFVSRYDTTNLYHASEDWIHAFAAFSVLEVPIERSQVIIADGLIPGPFLDVWKELYSRNHPLLTVNDLQKSGVKKCYKYMAANVFGAISPLCKGVGRSTPCMNSTLIRGFRDFFISSFKVKYLLPEENKLTITIIRRKSYARSAGSYQHVSRQIRNHDDLVAMAQATFPTAEVRSVDFASLSFREQLKLIRTTDILVGAHGAALSHMMFLPTTSVSIEFWVDDRFNNYHYENLGKWLAIKHIVEHQSNPLDLNETRKHLQEAAETVADNKKRRLYDH
jgi:hypothetical protein